MGGISSPRCSWMGEAVSIFSTMTPFRRMGLTDKNLKTSNTVFHGVVPGKSAYPVGKIALEVAFGDDHDSRSETLTFEVVKSRVRITPCLGDRLMPSSWHGRVMFTCSLRCQVIRGPSQYMGAGKLLWNVRKVMRLTLSRFVPRKS